MATEDGGGVLLGGTATTPDGAGTGGLVGTANEDGGLGVAVAGVDTDDGVRGSALLDTTAGVTGVVLSGTTLFPADGVTRGAATSPLGGITRGTPRDTDRTGTTRPPAVR